MVICLYVLALLALSTGAVLSTWPGQRLRQRLSRLVTTGSLSFVGFCSGLVAAGLPGGVATVIEAAGVTCLATVALYGAALRWRPDYDDWYDTQAAPQPWDDMAYGYESEA